VKSQINWDKEIGLRIKAIREKSNLSQQRLADKLKVAKNTILNYEKGKTSPTIKFLLSLSNFFHVPFDYFLYSKKSREFPFVSKIDADKPIFSEGNIKENKNTNELLPDSYNCFLTQIKEDLKEYSIQANDWVIIDTNIQGFSPSILYLIKLKEKKKTKIVFKVIQEVDKKYLLKPLKSHGIIHLYQKTELKIIGKVVRVIRVLKD